MAKKKEWREGEIVLAFGLTKIINPITPIMSEWLSVKPPTFSMVEQSTFDEIYEDGREFISTWSEEDLKMKFISYVLKLGQVIKDKKFVTFFDAPNAYFDD